MDSQTIDIEFYLVDNNQLITVLQFGQRYLFGRSQEAAFCLADTLASREHCEIDWNDRGMPVLRDLGSRNGTYINSEKIKGFRPLQDFDQVQVGGLQFTLRMLPVGSDQQTLVEDGDALEINKLETFQLSASGHFGATQGASFSGGLRDRKLGGLLRFFSLTDKTGVLILDDDPRRRIWFVEGTPRDAICDTLDGMDALQTLCLQPGDSFAFLEGEQPTRPATISGPERDVLGAVLPPTELAELGIDASDLARAEDLQKHLLGRAPDIPGYQIGLFYRGRSGVSGDLYDIGRMADGRLLIFLADVSGHGIQAAMVVTNTLKTLRFLRAQHHELLPLLTALNDEIRSDLLTGQFLTCFAALVDPSKSKVQIALAGHHPGLLFDLESGQLAEDIGKRGLGLGLMDGHLFSEQIQIQVMDLHPGDVLLQYTDGLSEASNADGEEFGRERIDAVIADMAGCSVQHLVDQLAARAAAFATSLADDCTILALHRLIDTDTTNVIQVRVGSDTEQSSTGTYIKSDRRQSTDTEQSLQPTHHPIDATGPTFDPGPWIGRVLGNVELTRHLGQSAVAHVFAGQHTTMDTVAAIKLMRLPAIGDARNQVLRRATAAGRISHTNVIQVFDAGTTNDGYTWLAMQLAENGDLETRIVERGRIRLGSFLSVAEPIASGLQAIHSQSTVHGDLRPANILFDQSDTPKIADFAIATRSGSHNPYIAPECCGGQELTEASDVFALGGIFQYMLTGTPPASEADCKTQLRKAVPGIEAPLLALLASCLHSDPNERPRANDLARRLRHAQTLYSSRQVALAPREPDRHTPWLLILLVVLLALACTTLLGLLLLR
jgi:hypothetical protein